MAAYADDLCFIMASEDTNLLQQTTQQVLHVIEDWGLSNSIQFCPNKINQNVRLWAVYQ
jgi:hypothetical protein